MNIFKRTLSSTYPLLKNFKQLRQYTGGIYEPEYLEGLKPKFPLYDTLNIQLRGYDYPILESYQKYLHNLIKNMDIEVEDCWPLPAQVLQICTYKSQSEVINAQYKLNLYDRTIQITDVPTFQIPLLLRVIDATAPAGVTINVVPHEDYHEEVRYVPDNQLRALKQELDGMGGPSKKK